MPAAPPHGGGKSKSYTAIFYAARSFTRANYHQLRSGHRIGRFRGVFQSLANGQGCCVSST